jgi:hypothetical protein
MLCNNKSQAHNLKTIADGDSAMRVYCNICKQVIIVRQDQWKGVPEKRQYAKVFKRDILQGNDNLLYKYRPELMQR